MTSSMQSLAVWEAGHFDSSGDWGRFDQAGGKKSTGKSFTAKKRLLFLFLFFLYSSSPDVAAPFLYGSRNGPDGLIAQLEKA